MILFVRLATWCNTLQADLRLGHASQHAPIRSPVAMWFLVGWGVFGSLSKCSKATAKTNMCVCVCVFMVPVSALAGAPRIPKHRIEFLHWQISHSKNIRFTNMFSMADIGRPISTIVKPCQPRYVMGCWNSKPIDQPIGCSKKFISWDDKFPWFSWCFSLFSFYFPNKTIVSHS